MKKTFFCLILLTSIATSVFSQKNQLLWYDKPAAVWEEALPIGNGRMGAMIFGNPLNELYQLNEITLWSGTSDEGNNSKAKDALPLIRKAIDAGDYIKAGQLWRENAQGPYSSRYEPLADMRITTLDRYRVTNIYRDLDLTKALSTVKYTANGVNYTRTSFMSHPDEVMVVKIKADKKVSVTFDLELTSQLKYSSSIENNKIVLKGEAPIYVAHRASDNRQVTYSEKNEGTSFEAHLEVKADGGTVEANGHRLSVKNADEVVLLFSAATSFKSFDKSAKLEQNDSAIKRAKTYLDVASAKSYDELLSAHIQDYKKLFDRVSFDLKSDDKAQEDKTTDKRLKEFQTNDSDNGLVALYYQFGRYLAISSSRTANNPSNLQGLWNHQVQPRWGSNYTVNINTEMNYWLTETTNMPELTKPLFSFMESLAINGAKTAKVNYGIDKGWVAHHNTDIWAKTSPTGNYDQDLDNSMASWSCWSMSSAWLFQHLWEHYAFGGDKQFLKEKAYPLMKGSAEFMLAWLQYDKELKSWVTSPSTSPENIFYYTDSEGKKQRGEVSKATTMDMAIIWDLFTNCIEASKILNVDKAFRSQLENVRTKLFPYQIGARGQLQEWYKDFDEYEPQHRHVSHLLGLHPGRQIQPRVTPELASAAKKTLLLRGDEGTGWAMAWKISFWARLEDGNHAYQILKNGLKYTEPIGQGSTSGGGTYPNLFDAHPPFQIDGNFGGPAGITEMLLQSHGEEVFVLPALPDHWSEGSIEGIRARGGFTVDLAWKDGKVTRLKVHSTLGGNCRIRSHSALVSDDILVKEAKGDNKNIFYMKLPKVNFKKSEEVKELEGLNLKETIVSEFETQAGHSYILYSKDIL